MFIMVLDFIENSFLYRSIGIISVKFRYYMIIEINFLVLVFFSF